MEHHRQPCQIERDASETPTTRRGMLGWLMAAAVASSLSLIDSAEARNRHGRKDGRGGPGNGRGHHQRGKSRI